MTMFPSSPYPFVDVPGYLSAQDFKYLFTSISRPLTSVSYSADAFGTFRTGITMPLDGVTRMVSASRSCFGRAFFQNHISAFWLPTKVDEIFGESVSIFAFATVAARFETGVPVFGRIFGSVMIPSPEMLSTLSISRNRFLFSSKRLAVSSIFFSVSFGVSISLTGIGCLTASGVFTAVTGLVVGLWGAVVGLHDVPPPPPPPPPATFFATMTIALLDPDAPGPSSDITDTVPVNVFPAMPFAVDRNSNVSVTPGSIEEMRKARVPLHWFTSRVPVRARLPVAVATKLPVWYIPSGTNDTDTDIWFPVEVPVFFTEKDVLNVSSS